MRGLLSILLLLATVVVVGRCTGKSADLCRDCDNAGGTRMRIGTGSLQSDDGSWLASSPARQ
jgi:hypothetical protein